VAGEVVVVVGALKFKLSVWRSIYNRTLCVFHGLYSSACGSLGSVALAQTMKQMLRKWTLI
jgi:hypothetical protein